MLEFIIRRPNPISIDKNLSIMIADNVVDLISTLEYAEKKYPAFLSFERIQTSVDLILLATVTNGKRRIYENLITSYSSRFTKSLFNLHEMVLRRPEISNKKNTASLIQSLRLLGPRLLGFKLLPACRKLNNLKDLASIRNLLEAGADPNLVVDGFLGNPSLHFVAGMRDRKLSDIAGRLLVEFGAQLNKVNKAGKTALDTWIDRKKIESKGNNGASIGWSVRPEWCCPLPTLLILAARVVRVLKIPYADGKTPIVLHSLIELRDLS